MARRFLTAVLAAVAWAFGRQRVAVVLMGSGCACAVYGAYLFSGTALALVVAACLLITLSILVGWE